ncbi:MAG: hypothetical protein C5B53_02665 [Candidatus Melainabacteria bacterium]|nr:MAG: hypothetical protein C5B53_02665 [Candidatus Melainabacteria bacterium]
MAELNDALVRRVRSLRSQTPPMSWEMIAQTLRVEAAAETRAAIEAVQQEERTTARPHATPQPAGAGGMKAVPVLAF